MAKDLKASYEELIRRSREASLLASCASLLGWDEQTYMPKGGSEHRGNQMALLAGLHHEKLTDPKIGELIAELRESSLVEDHEAPAAVNIREIGRMYRRATQLPRELVEEMARTTSVAQSEWVAARSKSSFAQFQPWLEKIVDLKRREAACVGFTDSAYDALLDEYEPGAKSSELAVLFESLRQELVPLVAAIAASTQRPDMSILNRPYPVDRQQVFGEAVAGVLGFDFHRGRLDVAAHPFCSGIGPGDCRITTRFNPNNLSEALFGIMHEVGHGLYDQGLLPEHHGTPMGEAISLGVHESQSRLWENAVGRSPAFWRHFYPIAKQVFHDALHETSPEAFLFAVNQVEASLIRVQADEVTYNLHILIRFELEQALISGDLAVADVPGAWNDKYRQYLGVRPDNDAEGCLQDIHWSAGLFGYFPTYSLGNVFAAQLFDKANSDLGDQTKAFERGEFHLLLEWLRQNVHQHGQRYTSSQLIKKVTGSEIDHRPLIRSLKEKYGPLYHL
ncbi:carboxypeptidase M32 [Singulisphaera sp. PoT]|uniref:carboxypeptidase M32 n=1 Tax=Singulisphaera sp. PoT TaxID=3411797 RepID=UPI003BF578EE